MSIVPMKKVTLVGSDDNKVDTLRSLQDFGLVHIVPLIAKGKPRKLGYDELTEAIKYVSDFDNSETVVQKLSGHFDADVVVGKIIANKHQREEIKNRHKSLYQYIESVREWGDFKIPKASQLDGYQLFFYTMSVKTAKRLELPEGFAWHCVHIKDDKLAYVVVIAPEDQEPKITGAKRFEFLDMTYFQAVEAFEETVKELAQNQEKRLELSAYRDALMRYRDKLNDGLELDFVADYAWDRDGFFVVHGWIALADIGLLEKFAKRHDMAIIAEEPSDEDAPPTKLKNAAYAAPGEELVKFYQMPAYGMWDPSLVMFLSFALFFAMIMSDFAYGAMLAVITALVWKKMRTSEIGRRMRRMLMMLSGSCMVYGVICGSYFGYDAPIEALAKYDVVDISNFDSMIRLSVGIGALHLILANIIRFFQALPKTSAMSFIGWIMMIVGGFALYAVGQDVFWAKNFLIGGAATVLLFSSDRPLRGFKNIILRPIEGLLGLTNITKAFGDCLSYIRLFALGLSSALLASSFNTMAQQAMDSDTVFGIALGVLVFVFGHVLNLVLGIIGGLVHGLRLNFIEFSNWGLSGEGYPFKPFELKEKKKWKI